MGDTEAAVQLPELTTTLDPSYIIRLLRTFLAPGIETGDKSQDPAASQRLQENGHGALAQAQDSSDGAKDMDTADPSLEENGEGRISEAGETDSETFQTRSLPTPAEASPKNESAGLRNLRDDEGHQLLEEAETERQGGRRSMSLEGGRDDESPEVCREEAGCMLWDLAADAGHAQFLLQQKICDVVLAILSAAHSDRLGEIALGVLANLACHKETAGQATRWPGLQARVVQELGEMDPPTLTEVCRLLSAGLHSGDKIEEGEDGNLVEGEGSGREGSSKSGVEGTGLERGDAASWAEVLQSAETLERLLWIAENTNHPPLQEKSLEVLLALLTKFSPLVLPESLTLGLPARLTRMLQAQVEALGGEREEEGCVALDLLLQIGEALSLDSRSSVVLVQDSGLCDAVGNVLRLAAKEDLGSAVGSATILLANLVSEDRGLVGPLAEDPQFLAAFLRAFSLLDDDSGARAAFWCILTQATAHLLGECESVPPAVLAVVAEGAEELVQLMNESGVEEEREARAMQQQAVANIVQLLQGPPQSPPAQPEFGETASQGRFRRTIVSLKDIKWDD
ncbi:hypothetical protein KFL_000380325 [Klebsormidium nitens]|uniref:Uncharacterized protein n=1 Tax=Klebsormidium nitens TaxID=105231 RepID=A0A1Y1HMG1_KLENI|nr:hypothetical protein KFL_000380325 [Klebsormidium nitens]|eukprot:GAQ79800.1 hypothetical protein KFL_000380325 [Klebsormidium nitens]